MELALSEPDFKTAIGNNEAIIAFIKDQLTNYEGILVYRGNTLVSAGPFANLVPDNKGRTNLRFIATREYKFDYWRACVIGLAKYLHSKGFENNYFVIYDNKPEHRDFHKHFGRMASLRVYYELPK